MEGRLQLDREWQQKPHSYLVYRGHGQISEVYILERAMEKPLPTYIRVSLEFEPKRNPANTTYELELRKDQLGKVQSKYIYTSREMMGNSPVIGGVYVSRHAVGEDPPQVIRGSVVTP